MKNCLLLLLILTAPFARATVHVVQVWDGYMQFLPADITVQLGDTIDWLPLDQPSMIHTITSDNIPAGAATFNYTYQAPADTFFRYIPTVVGTYDYVCTPHVANGMIGSITVAAPTIGIHETGVDVKVYPNPTTDFLYISNYERIQKASLFSINGTYIGSLNLQKGSIDLRHLSSGQYFVQFESELKETKVIRFTLLD